MKWYFIATFNYIDVLMYLKRLTNADVRLDHIKLGNSGIYYYWEKEI